MIRRAPAVLVPSRRELFALAGGALLAPRARAESGTERQFLFVFCSGGWDQACVFAPVFGSERVDMDPLAAPAEVGGIPFVDHPDRPAVRAFFEAWAGRTCLLNGFEVRSIAHDRCTQLLLTGSSGPADDWAAVLAGASRVERLLPHVVVSGPAWSDQFGEKVVRVGTSGQLPALLDGSALGRSALPITPPSAAASEAVEAYVRGRAAASASRAGAGWDRRVADGYLGALDRAAAVREYAEMFGGAASSQYDFPGQLDVALDCLELGLARCASVRYAGVWSLDWDSHADNDLYQTLHFEALFGYLAELCAELDARVGADGRALSESVTVVVWSEMGRDPKWNAWNGRHHWTTTSALLIGAGVRGGRAVGAYDDAGLGRPVDLASGEVSDAGEALVTSHLGATLLAIGDVDPEAWAQGASPVAGVVA